MNKQNILAIIFLVLTFNLWGQENITNLFTPTNSPDAMAFSEVNFLPVNEYTGKPNINIPIYSFDLDGLTIPISLNYNYGGVKVNSVASNVGTNWSLSAGGMVVKDVQGETDEYDAGLGQWSSNGLLTANPSKKLNWDIFNVSAPGINTSFIVGDIINDEESEYVSITSGKELFKQGNKIKTYYNTTRVGTHGYSCIRRENEIHITSNNGYKYVFANPNRLKTKSRATYWVNGHEYGNEIWNWRINTQISSLDISSITSPVSKEEVKFDYELYTVNVDWNNLYNPPEGIQNYFMAKGVFYSNGSLKSKQQTFVVNNKKRLKKITFKNGTVEFFYNFPRNDIFESGLYYENNSAALTRILVKNNHGKIIKDARLNYSSKQSVENCTDYECNRLFLNSIKFYDAQNSELPGYIFQYNNTKLPKRYSYKQDFLGFYNGAVANPEPTTAGHYIPKTYWKPNSGRDSYLPINLGLSGYTALNGNYSLASNETYAKAGILEKITYPTGGYMILEPESNDFKYLGKVVSGGGLRLKSQKVLDWNNQEEIKTCYRYVQPNGETSGSITFMPRFNDYQIKSRVNTYGAGFGIYQSDMANQKLTANSYVGYSRVEILNNCNTEGISETGKVVKEFTSPSEYQNINGSWQLLDNTGWANVLVPHSIINDAVNNGTFPDIVTDRDVLRGKLKRETVYNVGNQLIKKTEYNYNLKEYENLNITNSISFPDPNGDGADVSPSLNERANLKVERNLTSKVTETNYTNNGGTVVNTKNIEYYDDYPFVKKEHFVDSNNKTITTGYAYPFENIPFENKPIKLPGGLKVSECEIGGLNINNELSSLVEKNIISTPYYTYKTGGLSENKKLIGNDLNLYKKYSYGNIIRGDTVNFDNTPLLYKNISSNEPIFEFVIGGGVTDFLTQNNEPESFQCKLNDHFTNFMVNEYIYPEAEPIEIQESDDGNPVVLVWGYNRKHLIARIEGMAINSIFPNWGTSNQSDPFGINSIVSLSNADNDRTIGSAGNEGALRQSLSDLRNNLSEAMVTTYTYKPLIGVTSVTQPNGQTQYYEYDGFGRLKQVKDQDGNVLSENEYHYKP